MSISDLNIIVQHDNDNDDDDEKRRPLTNQ